MFNGAYYITAVDFIGISATNEFDIMIPCKLFIIISHVPDYHDTYQKRVAVYCSIFVVYLEDFYTIKWIDITIQGCLEIWNVFFVLKCIILYQIFYPKQRLSLIVNAKSNLNFVFFL